MSILVLVHVDPTDDGVSWWAESDDLPGFYALDDSLAGLRLHISAAVAELAGADEVASLRLVPRALEAGWESESDAEPAESEGPAQMATDVAVARQLELA